MFHNQDSNITLQHCVYSRLYRIACEQYNYITVDSGISFCCAEDYCNSEEKFLEFRANLSATTPDNVGQVTPSTSKLTSTTSYNVGKVTSSTSKLTSENSYNVGKVTSSTSNLKSTTSWIPTVLPTASSTCEFVFSL